MRIEISHVGVSHKKLIETFSGRNNAFVLDSIREEMEENEYDPEDIELCIQIARKFLSGIRQDHHDNDEFCAYLWILGVIGEETTIPSLDIVNSSRILKESGIWKLLTTARLDFVHPISLKHFPPPGIGAIDCPREWEQVAGFFTEFGFTGLEVTPRNEILRVQEEFSDVVESLAEEELHLVTLVTN
ncbi:MAG: hypothetical protein AAF456_02000 [Planctomycetota bacterium]